MLTSKLRRSVWLALSACAGADTAPDSGPPAAQALKLEPDACPLESAIQATLGWSGYVVDCGSLASGAPSSEWRRAQRCVLAAQRARIAYRLSYALPSYDSLDSAGIAAQGSHGTVVMLQRSSWSSAPWRMHTQLSQELCRDLTERADCSVGVGELCLSCEGGAERRARCQELSRLPGP